jgi:glucose/arabinose dehydrogenase
LNHGIDVSVDGKTLFVSSLTEVSSYSYDAAAGTVGPKQVLLNKMTNGGYHLTRTMIASKKSPGLLVIQRGSDGNVDAGTATIASGRSQVRVFNISALTTSATTAPLDYSTSGEVLGWGLRNSVGWGEDPTTGGIVSSVLIIDQLLIISVVCRKLS